MKIYHITWASQGRQPAFPAEEARRAALRALASAAGRDIVLFAIIDDHVHTVVLLAPARLRRAQGALSKVLNNRSAVPFAPPFVGPFSRGATWNRWWGTASASSSITASLKTQPSQPAPASPT